LLSGRRDSQQLLTDASLLSAYHIQLKLSKLSNVFHLKLYVHLVYGVRVLEVLTFKLPSVFRLW